MRTTITQDTLKKLPAGPCEIRDTKMPGLILRIRESGHATWTVVYGRGKRETIGKLKALNPEQARTLAQGILGDVAHGKDPQAERRKRRAGTLGEFLEHHYEPWVVANRKTGDQLVARIRTAFSEFLTRRLGDITPFALETWRTKRRRQGREDTTINRDLDALRAALSKAIEWGVLTEHPMKKVKRTKVDARGRIRYLDADEEQRLRQALRDRDQARRDGRDRFNQWRKDRGYKSIGDLGIYADHLTPIVLLAMNTGLRRGELLALRWADIDGVTQVLSVRGITAKSGLTRHVPLNSEARQVLKTWQACSPTQDLVFPGPNGKPMFSLKTAWMKLARAAKLSDFTYHDLRHHFASKLVMAGVDLNVVRELLGHSNIGMTLRYAHLAPEHRAAAVEKLVAHGA
jgi:integrase